MKRMILIAAVVAVNMFAVSPIPQGAKVVVTSSDGFDVFLTAAIAKKGVPVTVVASKEQADYELQAVAQSEKPGWAKVIFKGQVRSDENASIRLVNLSTGEIVFAYTYNMGAAFNGKQSSAESCAKHLKKAKIWARE